MYSKKEITIINTGTGNLNVFVKKLFDFGLHASVSDKESDIYNATFLLIPGIGHFGEVMHNLKQKQIINALNEKVIVQKTPIIGICLGMQLFTRFSEEGYSEGLGWINAETKKFSFKNNNSKVPHIGWKKVETKYNNSFFSEHLDYKFYFLHSYYVNCFEPQDVLTYTLHEDFQFCSTLKKNNIVGFQFHPEKSHMKGMSFLVNAINIMKQKYGE